MSRAGAVTACLAAVSALAALLLGASPSANAAPDSGGALQVVLDEFTPAIPQEKDTLVARGRVVNTSSVTVTDVRVGLRKSSSAIVDRADIDRIADTGVNPRQNPDDVALPGTIVNLGDELAPGGRASFAIEVPIKALGLPAAGTYVVGIEALGIMDEAGVASDGRRGITRTFLPWYPQGSVDPVDVVWLWPLADWPARTATGVLLDDRTPKALAEGGRLDTLVDLGERFTRAVSWVADPQLLQTASDMTSGYLVDVDGTTELGTAEGAARTWLDRVRSATKDGAALHTVPYADIDASAVTRSGMTTDVVRAATSGPVIAADILGSAPLGGLYWAPTGRLDRATVNVLASSGTTDIVLGSDSMPPTDPALAGVATTPTAMLPTSAGAIRAILADSAITRTLTLPARTEHDSIAMRQRFLAQTGVLAQLASEGTSEGADIVVAPPTMRWNPSSEAIAPLLRATTRAPWMRPMSLDSLLAEPVSSISRQRGGYGDKARDAELPAGYMASVGRLSADLDAFTSILDDPSGVSEPFSSAILRAQSSAWRSEQRVGEELVAATVDELADQASLVRVLSSGTITLSGDTGRVPVTIANDLDRAVTVGLALFGVPRLRLESAPLNGIRIEPGKMASVDLDARVVGGDPLRVNVQLLTPDGDPYFEPTKITVMSTAYSRAAAWVVAMAFVAIVVFVVFGVFRRIHAARSSRTQA